TPQRFLDENFDIGNTDPKDIGHISLNKDRSGNLGAEFFSIWVDPGSVAKEHFAQHTLDLIDSVYEQVARHPDRMMMAYSVEDIERARKQKKLAGLMGPVMIRNSPGHKGDRHGTPADQDRPRQAARGDPQARGRVRVLHAGRRY